MPSQVSRSIGDAYLKRAEFNKAPLLPKFRLPEPFEKPILLAEPSILVQELLPQDEFLIFASDGLWEHLSNQEAVDFVHSSPRNVRFLHSLIYYYLTVAISAALVKLFEGVHSEDSVHGQDFPISCRELQESL